MISLVRCYAGAAVCQGNYWAWREDFLLSRALAQRQIRLPLTPPQPFTAMYSGDHDRLRSEQELRCAICMVGFAHCPKAPRFFDGFKKSGGGPHRAQPVGAGQDAALGKR